MLAYLIILLLVLPFVDLFILVELTGIIGFWTTLVLILLTGIIGAGIVKKEGIKVLGKLQRSVTAEEVSRNILEGALVVFGGLLLLSPGLITDFLGLLMVWSPTRARIVVKVAERFKDRSNVHFEVQRF